MSIMSSVKHGRPRPGQAAPFPSLWIEDFSFNCSFELNKVVIYYKYKEKKNPITTAMKQEFSLHLHINTLTF